MKLVRLLVVLPMLFACHFTGQGQEVTPSPSPADSPASSTPDVSAAKRALIKEILDLTNSRTSSEAMFNAQFQQMERQMPEIQWQAISQLDEFKKLTKAQQEELHTKIKASSARSSQRIKELFLQRIDLKKLGEDISYTVYDKHFTEAELKDLAAFYRSDTGKKVVKEMPALFADSMAKASEIISPRINEIVEQVQTEETARLVQEITQTLKAPAKVPAKSPARKSSRRP